jgi:hypothetical protein
MTCSAKKYEKMMARTTANGHDGHDKRTVRRTIAFLLVAVLSVTSFAGCGSGKQPPAPEKKEEMRQKMIKNAERQRREG